MFTAQTSDEPAPLGGHWSQGVESLSQNVQRVLMEMDSDLYDASAVEFDLEIQSQASSLAILSTI